MIERVTSQYEHALQAAYYHIGNRGIAVDVSRIAEAKAIVRAEVARQLAIASHQWGIKVFVGAANAPDKGGRAVNINAPKGQYALIKVRELGKLFSSYLNARLYQQGSLALFLSNYNVAGTLSGRRSSRRHT